MKLKTSLVEEQNDQLKISFYRLIIWQKKIVSSLAWFVQYQHQSAWNGIVWCWFGLRPSPIGGLSHIHSDNNNNKNSFDQIESIFNWIESLYTNKTKHTYDYVHWQIANRPVLIIINRQSSSSFGQDCMFSPFFCCYSKQMKTNKIDKRPDQTRAWPEPTRTHIYIYTNIYKTNDN